ncbi:hypothetical protein SODALDRAFT_299709 [Sodiomyces alkalinus F11]|uniref:Uncharacterized protein n=1 Tax=Sodiomyces alkalinus (strain CBS 110278 / VKM F-3762 / F11) TaxID=1314773 RepID=A0A3N2PQ69_SODAK|nr:hypothetical protein SODALDRAFT_299709 [Sodiomyces alkalinus F11]ROT36645.1 hypothetical protein SODALDRAFT_299709 [Sodiomyces alkalinus F11]
MPRKRAASSVVDETPRRRSRRISSTPKKSVYFEDNDDLEGQQDDDYANEGASEGEKDAVRGADEEYDGEEEQLEDQNEDERPRVIVLPLEKLRELDGVEYEDTRLHKNTLLFLRDLKENNRRVWLKSHNGEFRRALKDWESFVETFTTKVIEADETIPELPPRDVIFRIYRDIRFTKDPTPYKPHFSAAWSRTGRKGPYACYYLHVEPGGNCFMGGGLWHPPASQVQALRASIDERPRRWRRVLNDERFKRTFFAQRMGGKPKQKQKQKQKQKSKATKAGGGGWGRSDEHEDDQEAALKAFAAGNQSNALKTKPKGYLADHRDVELLKLRNFTVGVKVEDDIFTRDDGQDRLAAIIQAMVPFITFLNRIVMPDSEEEDDESSDSGEGDGNAGEEEDEDDF